jgi:hypothetical protein
MFPASFSAFVGCFYLIVLRRLFLKSEKSNKSQKLTVQRIRNIQRFETILF